MPALKICKKCEIPRPEDEFQYRTDTRKRRGVCNICRKPGLRAAHRKWYANNPEVGRAASKDWRDRNPEKVAEQQQRRQSSGRQWEATKRWRENNPDTWAAVGHRYRARLHDATIEDTSEYRAILKLDPCSYCGKASEHIDHIDSLATGGNEANENLTSSCLSCNSSKWKTPLILWLAGASRDG